METLVDKISECTDDLGRLLDHIYKYPQKQRYKFYERIQSLSSRLLYLKGNLRECNVLQIYSQYNKLYLNTASLKGEVMSGLPQKEARNDMKGRKDSHNHEYAMRLIVEKYDAVKRLKDYLNTQLTITKSKYDYLTKTRQYLEAKTVYTSKLYHYNNQQKTDLLIINSTIRQYSYYSQILYQCLVHKKKYCEELNDTILQLNRYLEYVKMKLFYNEDKLQRIEQFAEVSMLKSKMVEENLKKMEYEATNINQNYFNKENYQYKQQQELYQYKQLYLYHCAKIKQLYHYNNQLNIELYNSETELHRITNSYKTYHDYKYYLRKTSDRLLYQLEIMSEQFKECNQNSDEICYELRKQLTHSKMQETTLRQKYEELVYTSVDKDKLIEQYIHNSKQKVEYNRKLYSYISNISYQLRKSLLIAKYKYVEVGKLRYKLTESEYTACRHKYDKLSIYYRLQEKNKERNELYRQIEVIRGKLEGIFKDNRELKEYLESRNKEIEALKIRVLRAKIETVQHIRQIVL